MLHSANGDSIFHVRLSVHFDYKWFVVKVIHRALIQGSSLSVVLFLSTHTLRSRLISQPADLKNNETLLRFLPCVTFLFWIHPSAFQTSLASSLSSGEKARCFRTAMGRTKKDGSLAFQGQNVPSRLLKHSVCTKSYYHDILFVQHSFRIDLNKQIKTNAGTFHICTLNTGMKNPWTPLRQFKGKKSSCWKNSNKQSSTRRAKCSLRWKELPWHDILLSHEL